MLGLEKLESRVSPASFVCQVAGPDFDIDILADVQIDHTQKTVATDVSFTATEFETEAKEVITRQRLSTIDTIFRDVTGVLETDLDAIEVHVEADMIDGQLVGRARQFAPGLGSSRWNVEGNTTWGGTHHAALASVSQARGNQVFIGPIDIREFNPDGTFIGPINTEQLIEE